MYKFMTFHRGVAIFFDNNGNYVVEDGPRKIKFPTEAEAQEYIDNTLEQIEKEVLEQIEDETRL